MFEALDLRKKAIERQKAKAEAEKAVRAKSPLPLRGKRLWRMNRVCEGYHVIKSKRIKDVEIVPGPQPESTTPYVT